MEPAAFRALFPVCARVAYLNAGSDGPLPAAAVDAARAELASQETEGRWLGHFDRRKALGSELRAAYASVLGCTAADVALTTSASEGLGKVLNGLDLGPGDEIVTSDQEHPGLLGPLIAARERGVRIRTAPLADLASAVSRETTVVACSHVGWWSGEVADPALTQVDVPLILDGAQGAGAIPVDVVALRCAAYAAAGQKWMCGADGTGMLYLEPGFRERLRAIAPGYTAFADESAEVLHADARRHDTPSLPREALASSAAAARVLADAGWDWVHARGRTLAATLAAQLAERGRRVGPRGDTTLVAWEDPEPVETRTRLNDAGLIVRSLPRTSYLRASVGAWNDEGDLERLLAAL